MKLSLNQLVNQLNPNMNQEQNIASMSNVVIEKSKLLEILKENKQKHDVLFNLACEGFWDAVKQKIGEKQKEFANFLAEVQSDFNHAVSKIDKKVEAKDEKVDARLNIRFNFNDNLGLVYPESHSKDYDRAIRLVELSVYDRVSLNENEFEQYVLNNWEWKERFLLSNGGYVGNVRSRSSENKAKLAGVLNGGEYVTSVLNADVNAKLEF